MAWPRSFLQIPWAWYDTANPRHWDRLAVQRVFSSLTYVEKIPNEKQQTSLWEYERTWQFSDFSTLLWFKLSIEDKQRKIPPDYLSM